MYIFLEPEAILEYKNIEEEIEKSIKGSIVDSNASSSLKKIRRNIDLCEGKIQEKLKKFLQNPNHKKYIQEFFISKRNERFTVPIKASYKNQVEGTIIEVSSKGSTVFMEPATISKYTTELSILKTEEMVEEYRILGEISNLICENIREIRMNIEIIAEFDMIFAKAKYSKAINGIKPNLNSTGYINIVNGKHPLLKGSIVPLNFSIGKGYRSLIITGPNAGGKTIVLKTVGILTLAIQSGFHIMADKETTMCVFDKIFVDIGDNQSIENSLSTFSSHMKNLSSILNECNKSSLILCDEIGSGTEPNEGAALAIAVLEEFYHKGSITVATTHYGEIKNFSSNHKDFENAAMEFEKETLNPLYKLLIGKSGQSNALWISKKMGIKDSILEKAKRYIDSKQYNYSMVKESKINKKEEVENKTLKENFKYEKGDKVLLLEFNESAIVYEGLDDYNNIKVFYKNEFVNIHVSRLKLEFKADQLYPQGYDLDSLFVSFKERKLERDIERGSKKALKKIQKEIRNRK